MKEHEKLNLITDQIIAGAISVHRSLGPGLLESTYEVCLAYELTQRKLFFQQQVPLPVVYNSVRLNCGYRLDLFIENKVIVEIKSVEALLPINQAQLLSYLKLANCSVGLLINFNVTALRYGLRRVVNGFPEPPRPLRPLR